MTENETIAMLVCGTVLVLGFFWMLFKLMKDGVK